MSYHNDTFGPEEAHVSSMFSDMDHLSRHGDPTVTVGYLDDDACECCGDRLDNGRTCDYCGHKNAEVPK